MLFLLGAAVALFFWMRTLVAVTSSGILLPHHYINEEDKLHRVYSIYACTLLLLVAYSLQQHKKLTR
jgi:hypothetical protein